MAISPRAAGSPGHGTVLVTDGEERATLAVVRSLGAAGWRVIVCGSSRRAIAGVSSYCARYLVVPSPRRDPHAFVSAVAAFGSREHVDLILPVAEASLFALSASREAVPGGLDWLPGDHGVRDIHDKALVSARAREAGLSVPETVVVSGREEVLPMAAQLAYPLVVKPSRTLIPGGNRGELVRIPASYADAEPELVRLIESLPDSAFPLLLQPRLVGAGLGVFLLMWDQEVRAAFMHRRLREKPPSGGVSVARESIPLRPELVDRSARLLRSVSWRGVAMIEFKEDRPGGTPMVLEVNGRFWGSLQLAIDAGVDFPRHLADLASGFREFATPEYRPGVRLSWEWGEVDHCLSMMRSGWRERRSGGLRRAAAAIGTLLRPEARNRWEILRAADPRPFLIESLRWFTRGER